MKFAFIAKHRHIWPVSWLYVAVILDLSSRRIVGWSMKAKRDAGLVMDALMMAVWRRDKADALLHHSGQDSQGGFKQDKIERVAMTG